MCRCYSIILLFSPSFQIAVGGPLYDVSNVECLQHSPNSRLEVQLYRLSRRKPSSTVSVNPAPDSAPPPMPEDAEILAFEQSMPLFQPPPPVASSSASSSERLPDLKPNDYVSEAAVYMPLDASGSDSSDEEVELLHRPDPFRYESSDSASSASGPLFREDSYSTEYPYESPIIRLSSPRPTSSGTMVTSTPVSYTQV